MDVFASLEAVAAPLPVANIDTDKILPAQFLKTISRTGLGEKLFWSWRQSPDFVLNRRPWSAARIIIALDNFGCGSSREHAPWALLDFGIRCVIAPSIADIFYNNCFKNGILPIVLPSTDVARLMALAANPAEALMQVDLVSQTVKSQDGKDACFEIDAPRKAALLQGVDEIDRTLRLETALAAFEREYRRKWPWLDPLDDLSSNMPVGRARPASVL